MDYIRDLQTQYEKSSPDPRTTNLPLMQSILPVVYISLGYVAFVILAPLLMRWRGRPFNIKSIMTLYNVALVSISLYMGVEILLSTYNASYDYICAPFNAQTKDNPAELRVTRVLYIHFLSKIVELLDTVFMILRRKDKQLSFLHVYHHVLILNTWWWVIKYIPGGLCYFGACFNSFVHVVMYAYYLLATFPSLTPYLWWKKYITKLQMTQFWSCFLHVLLNIYLACDYPRWGQMLIIWISLTLLVLFANFYIKAYLSSKQKKKLH